MLEYVELSAKNVSSLENLDTVFVRLSRAMLDVRQSMEMTRSMVESKANVVTLSDDWEVITAPEAPIPTYAYRSQDAARSRFPKKCAC